MAKWYNEKDNEEILKKIEEIKGEVSAFAKESIDTSLSAIDKAQNSRLEIISKELQSIRYGMAKSYDSTERDILDLESKLHKSKSDHSELLENLSKQVAYLHQWQDRMLALDVILFLFLLGLILFLNV